jgi:PAS domain S-box-containing protein
VVEGGAGAAPDPPGGALGGMELTDSVLLETLVLEAPVAFVLYDTDLRYRRINRMLAEINGLPMTEHIGRRPSEILPVGLGAAVEARLREVLRTGLVVVDDDFTALSPRTGETCHYQSQWFPARDPGGTVIGVAVLVTDVTDRWLNEAALRASQSRTLELQHATAALAGALTVREVRRTMRDIGAAVGSRRTEVVVTTDGRPDQPLPDPAPGEVVLPLRTSGREIGALRMVLDDAAGTGPPTEEDQVFLEALAGQCALALGRARLYERERATAAALQRSLLPDVLPTAPGIELAAQFRPGSEEADVGGDWYDAFPLPDGRMVLVVGDVMGKGVTAAAGMGRLRSALRALALVNPLPEVVLQGLDRVYTATEDADQIATLVYLLVHPEARRVAVGAAGHLPLVHVRADGSRVLVDAGSGSTPLGWPEPRGQQTLQLAPGDVLIGLTDGVVERRGHDLDEGLQEVLDVATWDGDGLEPMVERVAAAMLDATSGRDDATLLAVRFLP